MSTEYFIFNPGSQSYVPFVPDASEDQFQGILVLQIQTSHTYVPFVPDNLVDQFQGNSNTL